jgi:hypothetical protein
MKNPDFHKDVAWYNKITKSNGHPRWGFVAAIITHSSTQFLISTVTLRSDG